MKKIETIAFEWRCNTPYPNLPRDVRMQRNYADGIRKGIELALKQISISCADHDRVTDLLQDLESEEEEKK